MNQIISHCLFSSFLATTLKFLIYFLVDNHDYFLLWFLCFCHPWPLLKGLIYFKHFTYWAHIGPEVSTKAKYSQNSVTFKRTLWITKLISSIGLFSSSLGTIYSKRYDMIYTLNVHFTYWAQILALDYCSLRDITQNVLC